MMTACENSIWKLLSCASSLVTRWYPTKCNSDPITVKTEILQSCFVFVLPDVGSGILVRFAVGVATDARQLIAVAFLVASSAFF